MSGGAFTALVVLHDSRTDLERLLASIDRHLPQRPQVVAVDTGSGDGGAGLARSWGAEVLELEGNPGFGAANNAGLELARADVTVLLNPDVELLDGGLADLARMAGERGALLAPRLLNADGSVQRSAHPLPGSAAALLPAVVHPRVLPRALRERFDPWRAERSRPIGWAIAACLAAPTATLRRLGPFDPAAFLFYEDLELGLRARDARVAFELRPEVALRHAGAHSTEPAFGGEPFELLASRRREVIGARMGRRALALDDAAQALTFVTRAAGRRARRLDAERERAQLAALRASRRG